MTRLPAYEAQNEAVDRHMKKFGLEDQHWRPGIMEDSWKAPEMLED